MTPLWHLSLWSSLLLLTGCVSARATMLGSERYAPVPAEGVRIYLDETRVPEACERIALIHTEGEAATTDEAQMIAAARRRAGKVGANALLVDTLRDPSTGTRIAAVVFGVPADRKGQMLAFRCPESEASADSAGALER